MMKKTVLGVLFLFSLFVGLNFAATTFVSSNFQNNFPSSSYHFNSEMSFSTDFSLSVPASGVPDPSAVNIHNLPNGAQVCQGATVTVTPTTTALWATSPPDIRSMFPACSPIDPTAYCPADFTIAATPVSNANINWVSNSVFNDVGNFNSHSTDLSSPASPAIGPRDFVQGWDAITGGDGQAYYDELGGSGSFVQQQVTYNSPSAHIFNARADAGVFCLGNLRVTSSGSPAASSTAMPTTSGIPVTFSTTGLQLISTDLNGVSCFSAMTKYPINSGSDHPDYFYLFYFTNNKPSIPVDAGITFKSLNVVGPGSGITLPACTFSTGTVVYRPDYSVPSSGLQVFDVDITNTDSRPITVNSVSLASGTTGYTVTPVADCSLFCFPPYFNGFGHSISPGATRTFRFALQATGATPSSSVSLIFDANTSSPVCGTSPRCSQTVPVSAGVLSTNTCTISSTPSPPVLEQYQVGDFSVLCSHDGGPLTPCPSGGNWDIDPSTPFFTGYFVNNSHTDESVQFYPSSPSSSGDGNLRYTSSNGAVCTAAITVNNPNARCIFVPNTLTLNVRQSSHFSLVCSLLSGTPGVVVDPLSMPTYNVLLPLVGTKDHEDLHGLNFTPTLPMVIGDLEGLAPIAVPSFGTRTYGARATVTVPATPIVSSCTITPGTLTVAYHNNATLSVSCASGACPRGGSWSVAGGTDSGYFHPNPAITNDYGTIFYPNSDPGTTDLITYTPAGGGSCGATVTVVSTSTFPTDYNCTFNPANATLVSGASQHFERTCVNSITGAPASPVAPYNYYPVDGLNGFVSAPSAAGADFIGGTPSTGHFLGIANFSDGSALSIANVTVTPLSAAVSCTVTPSSHTLENLVAAQFHVTCYNSIGTAVPCFGHWAWDDPSHGGIFSESDTDSIVYPTASTFPSLYQLSYTYSATANPFRCNSTISVIAPNFNCQLTPNPATLIVGTSQFFNLNCFAASGVPEAPSRAIYSQSDSLHGSREDRGIIGTNFTGGNPVPNRGNLYGIGVMPSHYSGIDLGPIGVSFVSVTSNSSCTASSISCPAGMIPQCLDGNVTCICGPTPPPGFVCPVGSLPVCDSSSGWSCTCTGTGCSPGSSNHPTRFCTINNGFPISLFPGYNVPIPIVCGPPGHRSVCSSFGISISGPGILASTDPSGFNSGFYLNTTGSIGMNGTVDIIIGHSIPPEGCSSGYSISAPQCIDTS